MEDKWGGQKSCPVLWGQVSAGEVHRGWVSMWVTKEWVWVLVVRAGVPSHLLAQPPCPLQSSS